LAVGEVDGTGIAAFVRRPLVERNV
jgi:hypothetical protein